MMNSRNARLLLLAVLSALSAACANDKTTVYQTAPGTAQTSGTQQSSAIPSGVWLDSVNAVSFYQSVDGLVIRSDDTSQMPDEPKGFNGGGLGNKAWVGVNELNGMLASDLKKIEFEARQDRGTPLAFLNLQIDCDGNGAWDPAVDAVVVVDSDQTDDVSLTFPLDSAFKRFSISRDQALFKAVVGSGEKCNLPSHLGFVRKPLSALPSTARLFNGETGDGGMPRATKMPALLYVMNDSGVRTSKQVTLRELKVNDKSYRFTND